MRTFISNNKGYFIAFLIVIGVCLLARLALAKEPTAQQEAAKDILVQQAILVETKESHDRYLAAEAKLSQNLACVQDPTQCPLSLGMQQAD